MSTAVCAFRPALAQREPPSRSRVDPPRRARVGTASLLRMRSASCPYPVRSMIRGRAPPTLARRCCGTSRPSITRSPMSRTTTWGWKSSKVRKAWAHCARLGSRGRPPRGRQRASAPHPRYRRRSARGVWTRRLRFPRADPAAESQPDHPAGSAAGAGRGRAPHVHLRMSHRSRAAAPANRRGSCYVTCEPREPRCELCALRSPS